MQSKVERRWWGVPACGRERACHRAAHNPKPGSGPMAGRALARPQLKSTVGIHVWLGPAIRLTCDCPHAPVAVGSSNRKTPRADRCCTLRSAVLRSPARPHLHCPERSDRRVRLLVSGRLPPRRPERVPMCRMEESCEFVNELCLLRWGVVQARPYSHPRAGAHSPRPPALPARQPLSTPAAIVCSWSSRSSDDGPSPPIVTKIAVEACS